MIKPFLKKSSSIFLKSFRSEGVCCYAPDSCWSRQPPLLPGLLQRAQMFVVPCKNTGSDTAEESRSNMSPHSITAARNGVHICFVVPSPFSALRVHVFGCAAAEKQFRSKIVFFLTAFLAGLAGGSCENSGFEHLVIVLDCKFFSGFENFSFQL